MTDKKDKILDSKLRLPQHVVHRSFVSETVVLNLKTGKYHGLNPMAGQMLDALEQSDSVRDAVVSVAAAYHQDPAVVEADLVAFCEELLERNLVEFAESVEPAPGS
jgi:hypothetical protein